MVREVIWNNSYVDIYKKCRANLLGKYLSAKPTWLDRANERAFTCLFLSSFYYCFWHFHNFTFKLTASLPLFSASTNTSYIRLPYQYLLNVALSILPRTFNGSPYAHGIQGNSQIIPSVIFPNTNFLQSSQFLDFPSVPLALKLLELTHAFLYQKDLPSWMFP